MRRGRLERMLGATQPLFRVWTRRGSMISDLTALHITLGNGEPSGLSTSTASVSLAYGLSGVPYDGHQGISIQLTDYGTELLEGLTGHPGEGLRHRFNGRVAKQQRTDHGFDVRGFTRITCSDWLSMVPLLDPGGRAARTEPTVNRLYRWAVAVSDLPISTVELLGASWFRVYLEPGVETLDISTTDVFGKFAADLGHLIRQRRDGQHQALSHDYLTTLVETWESRNPQPLLRSQALAPSTWEQDATLPVQILSRYRAPDGTVPAGESRHGAYGTGYVVKGGRHDFEHVYTDGSTDLERMLTRHRIVEAAAYRSSGYAGVPSEDSDADGSGYVIKQVTVPILRLLHRGLPVDRALVGQLLSAQQGDPIALAHDWGDASRVYVITQLDDVVTRDDWQITLTLMPQAQVTGNPVDVSVDGPTWDSAYPADTTWDSAPTTTWETSP